MPISRPFTAAAALVAMLALAACGQSHTSINISDGGIMLHDGYVTVHAEDAPTATVTEDGALRVGSRDIAVNPAQRQLLRSYYGDAERIGHQGVAIGKAGARMAGGTIGDVFKNLFSGHPDRIDSDVNRRTDKLLAKVQGICNGLQSLQSTQDALAGQLAAFRPYARLHASDIDKCHADITKARSKIARDTH